jgi:hypothetical protein
LNTQADKIPQMKEAQLGQAEEAIAVKLFGIDAYDDAYTGHPMVKGELHDFINTMLSYIWNQSRKAVKIQHERLERGKEMVKEEYESTWREIICM